LVAEIIKKSCKLNYPAIVQLKQRDASRLLLWQTGLFRVAIIRAAFFIYDIYSNISATKAI